MYTQVEKFTDKNELNAWLKETGVYPEKVIVAATQYTVHYVIVYEIEED